MKQIVVASDHAAIRMREEIVKHLRDKGYDVQDLGPFTPESADYPDYAAAAAEKITTGCARMGILICGTGIGMSMAANKIKGIRCALLHDAFSAKATREHNDANMMSLGERVTGIGLALTLVDIFLETPFSGEARHCRRIEKISALESKD